LSLSPSTSQYVFAIQDCEVEARQRFEIISTVYFDKYLRLSNIYQKLPLEQQLH